MKNIKHIIREIPAEQSELSFYFDDDGLKEISGDYCNSLFIVAQSDRSSGFNEKEYAELQNEIENLLEMYNDIINKSNYANYSSIGAMLFDYGIINNIHNSRMIKKYIAFFQDCNTILGHPYSNRSKFNAHNEEMTAEYLKLKTGKQWTTDYATGYSQGDYVKMVYCADHYTQGVKHYGEVWLGAAKEFCTIDLDENGQETNECYGFIVADCQARNDDDYKKLVCNWAGLDENKTRLEMIDGQKTYTKYSYRAV